MRYENKTTKKCQYMRGFTIIELLVVLAIILIIPMIVISNVPIIKLQFALSNATYEFAQDLRMAQNMALSPLEYKDSFGILQPIDGYGISIDFDDVGNVKYRVYADKKQGNQVYDPLDYIVKTIDLGNRPGIVIKEIRTDEFNRSSRQASINFSHANTYLSIYKNTKSQTMIEVVFAIDSDQTRTKIVSVNSAGLIEIR